MTREQIGRALEYSDESMLKQLHNRNKQLDDMSVGISTLAKGGVKMTPTFTNQEPSPVLNFQHNTLLYNEDGIYEITFLSRQPRANEFRAWVRERIKEIRKFGFTTATDGKFFLLNILCVEVEWFKVTYTILM